MDGEASLRCSGSNYNGAFYQTQQERKINSNDNDISFRSFVSYLR
jgi:hypothetical protein